MKNFLRYLSNWFYDPQHLIAFAGLVLLGFLVLYGEHRVFWLLVLILILTLLFLIVIFIAGVMIVKQQYYQFANLHFGGRLGVICGVIIMILSVLAFVLTLTKLIDLLDQPLH